MPRQELSFEESDSTQPVTRMKKNTLIRGINNIGNTCFINSIIQCLVATPVLDRFLLDYPFDETKTPVGFGLGRLAQALLANEKAMPNDFKKLLDVHMPQFSGYDQHDAQ